METFYKPDQLETLIMRLRQMREARDLTLEQAAKLSNNEITAIALGSYERGDRSITASKLLRIASMYQVPVAELFNPKVAELENSRVTFDIRKLLRNQNQLSSRLLCVLKSIAAARRDWNGEILSLRSSDLRNFQDFSGFTFEELTHLISIYKVPSSK